MHDNKKIGERLKELREKKGVNQVGLAKMLGVKKQTVSQWENGEREPKLKVIVLLAEYYDVTCDYILLGVKSENVDINRRLGISDRVVDALETLKQQEEHYGVFLFNSLFQIKSHDKRDKHTYLFDSILFELQSVLRVCAAMEIEKLHTIGGEFRNSEMDFEGKIVPVVDDAGEKIPGWYGVPVQKDEFIRMKINQLEERLKTLLRTVIDSSLDVYVNAEVARIFKKSKLL